MEVNRQDSQRHLADDVERSKQVVRPRLASVVMN